MTALACSASRSAAGVGVSFLPDFTKRSTPNSEASAWICRLTAAGESRRFSAARVIVGEWMTSSNDSSCRISLSQFPDPGITQIRDDLLQKLMEASRTNVQEDSS